MLDENEMRISHPDSSDEIATSKVLKLSSTKSEKIRNMNMELILKARKNDILSQKALESGLNRRHLMRIREI